MPTTHVILDVLFLLATFTAIDARPRPSNFLMLNHSQNLLHRSTEEAVSSLNPTDEVAPVASLDHPVAVTTMFDFLNPQPPFAASTLFDPFHPAEAGRSSPGDPQTSQPAQADSTRPSLMPSTIRDFITSPWDAGTILPTSISQIATVYIPEFTVCPIQPVRSGYPLFPGQSSTPNDMGRQSYSNSSTSPYSRCSTHYSSTATPICRTNITPLGNFPIAITDCKQNVTFSTDHGYTLMDNRTLVSKTTKYVAPWDCVVTGVPQGVVEAEVCQQDGPCTTYHEVWGVEVVMVTLTSISTVDFSAVVTGPSEVVFAGSETITIAESVTTTLSISSTVEVETMERSPVIVRATLDPPTPAASLRTTLYSTKTVVITMVTGRPTMRRPSPLGISDG